MVGLGNGWRRATRRGDDPCQAHPCDSGFLVVGRPVWRVPCQLLQGLGQLQLLFFPREVGRRIGRLGFHAESQRKKSQFIRGKKRNLNWDEPL